VKRDDEEKTKAVDNNFDEKEPLLMREVSEEGRKEKKKGRKEKRKRN